MIPPRIGSVPYLNARPLLEGLETSSITELVPAKLCEGFNQGMFDAALLSSIDILSLPNAEVVDGVAIASRGAVHSVILTYTRELKSIQKIHLDPSSHTSNALLRIILEEFYGMHPEYGHFSEEVSACDARLIIGDPAISFRKETLTTGMKILDLGEEWYRQTGLPFVFALWVLSNEFTNKKLLSDRLREAKNLGLSRLQEIAGRTDDPDFALSYLSKSICYDLGEQEKRGLMLYGDFLRAKNEMIFL